VERVSHHTEELRGLYQQRADVHVQRRRLVSQAELERRSLTRTEKEQFDGMETELTALTRRIEQSLTHARVDQVLALPADQRNSGDLRLLHERRQSLVRELRALVDEVEDSGRNLTPEELTQYDRLQAQFDAITETLAEPVPS